MCDIFISIMYLRVTKIKLIKDILKENWTIINFLDKRPLLIVLLTTQLQKRLTFLYIHINIKSKYNVFITLYKLLYKDTTYISTQSYIWNGVILCSMLGCITECSCCSVMLYKKLYYLKSLNRIHAY